MSFSEEEKVFLNSPIDIAESEKIVPTHFLPTKSREKYENTYDKFIEWRVAKKINSFSENVLLTYFNESSHNCKPSTLWSRYSMLKSTINAKNNIDISTYRKLSAFLKRQSTGFKSKKSQVLTSNDVEKFLNEAPDNKYLATKVALVLGVTGACRREELCNITMKDINDNGSMALITLPCTKSNNQRTFTVHGGFYDIFKTYAALRPKNTTTDRFFLKYLNGKCTHQVIGINKFGSMPKLIATYLKLPNPENYNGHSFRQTSVTLLTEAGADVATLKRHRGWKSNQDTEKCIEDQIDDKTEICKQITESVLLRPSTTTTNTINIDTRPEDPSAKKSKGIDDTIRIHHGPTTSKAFTIKTHSLSLINCSNITINYIQSKD